MVTLMLGRIGNNMPRHILVQFVLVPIPDWKSCFRHPRPDLMLIVYVDDFKFAGPKHNLKVGWTLIR